MSSSKVLRPGDIAWAEVPFGEDDDRAKKRPVVILSTARIPGSGMRAVLVAGIYSATNKKWGENEVVLSPAEKLALGLDPRPAVIRFGAVAAVEETAVTAPCGRLSALPPLKAEAVRRAARRMGCSL